MNPNSFPKRPKGSSKVFRLIEFFLREEKAARINCPSVQVDIKKKKKKSNNN